MGTSPLVRFGLLAALWLVEGGKLPPIKPGNGLNLTPIKQGEFTFYGTISLKLDPEWQSVCAVTIIAEDRCFTACHCVAKEQYPYGPPPHIFLYPPSMIRVYSGLGPGGTYKFSEDSIALSVHPKCQVNESGFVYDFAVIQTLKPFHIKDHPEIVSTISFPGWKDGKGDAAAITKVIQSPDNRECVSLEFDLVGYRETVYQLGGVEVVAGLKMSPGDKCRDEWAKQNRLFTPKVQVCARRKGKDKPLTCLRENECALDAGALVLCKENPESKVPNIPIGITSGRDAPYFGPDVSEVYARFDAAWDYLTSRVGTNDGGRLETVPVKKSATRSLNAPVVDIFPIVLIIQYTLK